MNLLQPDSKDWGSSIKQATRKLLTVDLWRELMGSTELSNSEQYWTLGGDCYLSGKVRPGCELDFILKSKFCNSRQFHSIEGQSEIHARNQKLKLGNWYLGEFTDCLKQQASGLAFKPAFVNYDTCQTVSSAGERFISAICIARNANKRGIVIGNFVRKSRFVTEYNITEAIQPFIRSTEWQWAAAQGVTFLPRSLTYVNQRTKMSALVAWWNQ